MRDYRRPFRAVAAADRGRWPECGPNRGFAPRPGVLASRMGGGVRAQTGL